MKKLYPEQRHELKPATTEQINTADWEMVYVCDRNGVVKNLQYDRLMVNLDLKIWRNMTEKEFKS